MKKKKLAAFLGQFASIYSQALDEQMKSGKNNVYIVRQRHLHHSLLSAI
jgi:hypothetical protein